MKGRRLVVIEDSIVRGTTTRGKMGALRRAGASEIHLRVASPPIRHPCFYGIDFPSRGELIANEKTVDQIRDYLEVDSLQYLSLDGMLGCLDSAGDHYCTACWSGKYPIPVNHATSKYAFERYQLKCLNEAFAVAEPITYSQAGVNIDANDRMVELISEDVRRTHGPRVMHLHNAFAGSVSPGLRRKTIQAELPQSRSGCLHRWGRH